MRAIRADVSESRVVLECLMTNGMRLIKGLMGPMR